MKHPKRITALLITIAVCAATLLGIGVASAIAPASDGGGADASNAVVSRGGDNDVETVTAVVDTYWNAIDDAGDGRFDSNDNRIWTQDSNEYGNACASSTTTRIIRNGNDVAEITFDGKVDADSHEAAIGSDSFSWIETSPWHIEVAGLPKKDSNGSVYDYLIVQAPVSGFVTKLSERGVNDDDSLFAKFGHYKGSDATSIIPVSACWKDGGDAASRMPVKVGLYSTRDIRFPDGSVVAYYKDSQIAWVELNIGNSWYAEIVVPISGLSLSNNDFYIRELSTYEGDGSLDDKYKIVSRDEISVENIDNPIYDSVLRYWPETDTNFRMISANPKDGSAYKVSYDINNTIGSFQVTNQRVGSVEVSIDQNWLDVGADKSKRPECAVSVTSPTGDIAFVYTNDRSLSARVSGYGDVALYTEDETGRDRPLTGVDESLSENTDVAVSNSMRTLTFRNVDSSKDNSHFSIINLPKYDSQGAEINWEVGETWTGDRGEYQVNDTASDSVIALPSCSPVSWHHGDKLTFSLVNKRVGTKSVTYHAKWFDHYVKDELGSRPDLRFELYRQTYDYSTDDRAPSNSKLEPVSFDVKDIQSIWTSSAAEDRVADDVDGSFTQYVTIEDLPKYDDHGKLCVYYARAVLDSSSKPQSAIDYSYEVSVSKDSYQMDPGSWHDVIDEVGSINQEAATVGSGTAYREDSTFNFRIAGTVELAGSVQWKDVPSSYSKDDLPDVSVYVQRRMVNGSYGSDGTWTSTETPWSRLDVARDQSAEGYSVASSADGDDVDGKTAVAWTDSLDKSAGDSWSYIIANRGANTQSANANVASNSSALDAFDSEGRRYEYRVREVIDGMIGSAAFDESKFATSPSNGELEQAFAKLYKVTYEGDSIVNRYCLSSNSLVVNELFEDSEVHPDVFFKLYRFKQNGAGENELKEIAEKKLGNYDSSEKSIAFGDLNAYTLSGDIWNYVVAEVMPINFTATSTLGDPQSLSANYKTSAEWALANGVSLPTDGAAALSMGPAVQFDTCAASAVVTFKNTYDPGVTTLEGSIDWIDRDGVFGTRPDVSTPLFKLTRVYQDGSHNAEVVLQSSDPNAANYLVWTARSSAGANMWTFEIRNLEKLAPDFKPWKYTLTEDLSNTQYKLASGSNGCVSCDAGEGRLPAISNELKGQVGFATSWSGDADVRWTKHPAQYVALQARQAGSDDDWKEATLFFRSRGIDLSDSSEFEKFVDEQGGISQDSADVWRKLPLALVTSDSSAIEVDYRVVISRYAFDKCGSKVDVSLVCAKDGTYSVKDEDSFSPYMPATQKLQSDNDGSWKFNIDNVFQGGATTAKATYSWDDGNNAFDTRPDSASEMVFALQRSVDGGKTWQWVGDDGAALAEPFDNADVNTRLLVVKVPVSSSDVFLDGLPLKDVGADGAAIAYQYRFAMLVTDSYQVAGSSVAAASSDGAAWFETVEPVGEAQEFVNKLLTAEAAGKVVWNDLGSGLADSLDPTAVDVKLMVSRSVSSSSGSGAPEQFDLAPTLSKGSDGTWTYSLLGLPKLDKEGRECVYSVMGCDAKIPGWRYVGSNADGSLSFEALRLAFDAVDSAVSADDSSSSKLNGISFVLSDASGRVATWSRSEDGTIAVAVEDGFGASGSGASAGWIVGLLAGEYRVHESTVPSGYQTIDDFKVTIGDDGSVKLLGAPAGVSVGEDGFTVVVAGAKIPAPPVTPSPGDDGDNDDPGKPGVDDKPGSSGDSKDDDKPAKPGDGSTFVSEPVIDLGGIVAEDGVVTPTLDMTFTSEDGKEQVTLSSDCDQIDIELVDVATGTCKVTVKPEYLPAGYEGELREPVLVNLFEDEPVVLEEVQKATSSKEGYALYRGEDGTIYRVVIPKDNIKVSSPKKTLKVSSLKKGKKKFKIEVTDAKGKVTYKSSSKKWVKVSKKGVVTVKKGAKKGMYTITITSRATSTHVKAVKTVKFKVK